MLGFSSEERDKIAASQRRGGRGGRPTSLASDVTVGAAASATLAASWVDFLVEQAEAEGQLSPTKTALPSASAPRQTATPPG
jgi:hypothetical protein